jgi:hypothetical protein
MSSMQISSFLLPGLYHKHYACLLRRVYDPGRCRVACQSLADNLQTLRSLCEIDSRCDRILCRSINFLCIRNFCRNPAIVLTVVLVVLGSLFILTKLTSYVLGSSVITPRSTFSVSGSSFIFTRSFVPLHRTSVTVPVTSFSVYSLFFGSSVVTSRLMVSSQKLLIVHK